ncbi:uncharacterized protein LOC134280703 [Saccostrea cucullata]|uniref:uncharacterized protein LOC134280703 n=1 Tax=Saccostrea cuccullata TaxID=36930 RepID=UPI002ED6AE4F
MYTKYEYKLNSVACLNDDNVWTCGDENIMKLFSVIWGTSGTPLYSSGKSNKYIIENKNLDICVADEGAEKIVVVNQAGKLRFRYAGDISVPMNKHFYPKGITTDSQSHILINNHFQDCVHILDQDGQFLRFIYGLKSPWGLCVDTNDNLFVALSDNKLIKKITYMQES